MAEVYRGGVRCPACGCDPWTKGKPSPEARAQVHCEDAEKEAAKLRERVEKAEARIDDYQRLHQADAERIAYLESERDGARNELAEVRAHLANIGEPDLMRTPAPAVAEPKAEAKYPCAKCGKLRTKAEGGECLTTCEGLGFNCDGTPEGITEQPAPAEAQAGQVTQASYDKACRERDELRERAEKAEQARDEAQTKLARRTALLSEWLARHNEWIWWFTMAVAERTTVELATDEKKGAG